VVSRKPIVVVERGEYGCQTRHITLVTRVKLKSRTSSTLCPMYSLARGVADVRVPAISDQDPYYDPNYYGQEILEVKIMVLLEQGAALSIAAAESSRTHG
jgi:hypothetical protein